MKDDYMSADHKFFDGCQNSILKRFERLSSYRQNGNPLGAGIKFEIALKQNQMSPVKSFHEFTQTYYPASDMPKHDLNKKYVDYLHQQKVKGKEMPPSKKRKEAFNPEDNNESEIKEFYEYKKFKQVKTKIITQEQVQMYQKPSKD
jgi:hypothetical protein